MKNKQRCWRCDGIGGIFDKIPKWDLEKDEIVFEDDFVCCPYCDGTGYGDNGNFMAGIK